MRTDAGQATITSVSSTLTTPCHGVLTLTLCTQHWGIPSGPVAYRRSQTYSQPVGVAAGQDRSSYLGCLLHKLCWRVVVALRLGSVAPARMVGRFPEPVAMTTYHYCCHGRQVTCLRCDWFSCPKSIISTLQSTLWEPLNLGHQPNPNTVFCVSTLALIMWFPANWSNCGQWLILYYMSVLGSNGRLIPSSLFFPTAVASVTLTARISGVRTVRPSAVVVDTCEGNERLHHRGQRSNVMNN